MTQNRIFKIILTVSVLVAIFWSSKTVEKYFLELIDYAEFYMVKDGANGMVLFVVLAVFSIMLVSFSSIWLVPFAVNSWGNALTLSLLLGGWFIGSIISYMLGKYAGYPLISKIVSKEKIDKYHNLLTRAQGSFRLIILSRFVLPSEIPGYLLGIIKYPFAKYLVATSIGEIPFAFVMVYFIDAILNKNIIAFLIFGLIWVCFALLMAGMFKKMVHVEDAN